MNENTENEAIRILKKGKKENPKCVEISKNQRELGEN
jgi:hypothetical protein